MYLGICVAWVICGKISRSDFPVLDCHSVSWYYPSAFPLPIMTRHITELGLCAKDTEGCDVFTTQNTELVTKCKDLPHGTCRN